MNVNRQVVKSISVSIDLTENDLIAAILAYVKDKVPETPPNATVDFDVRQGSFVGGATVNYKRMEEMSNA